MSSIALVVLGWSMLVSIVIVPPADASVPDEQPAPLARQQVADEAFGTRTSGGSSFGAGAPGLKLQFLPDEPVFRQQPEEPEFRTWPQTDDNHFVNLETYVHITDGFEHESRRICFFFSCITLDWIPVGTIWRYRETDTGAEDRERCWGPTLPWTPVTESLLCDRDWEHSSVVTGDVTVDGRVQFLFFINGAGPIPWAGPWSDSEDVTVSEILSFGASQEAPIAIESGGFCNSLIGGAICVVGRGAADFFVNQILARLPWLNHVIDFLEGCGDAILDAAGGIGAILTAAGDLITNPGEFLDEQWSMIQDLLEAAQADPEGFALEVLGEIVQLDYLDEEGKAAWAGRMVCQIAIEILTSAAGAGIAARIQRFLRRTPDGPDLPRPCPASRPRCNDSGDRHDQNPEEPYVPTCRRTSSFPGDTLVLMADGSRRRIDAIRPGDNVLSHDLAADVWEPEVVLDQWWHLDDGPAATLTLADSTSITATDDHRFWVDSTGEWTELRHVEPGDALLTPSGTVVAERVDLSEPREWVVWELTVHANHNFTVFAGDTPVLVHNCADVEVEADGTYTVRDEYGDPLTGGRLNSDGMIEFVHPDGSKTLYSPDGVTRRTIRADGTEGPLMTTDVPRRIIKTDANGNPLTNADGSYRTQKPRQPSATNPNFDHDRTVVHDDGSVTYYRNDAPPGDPGVTYDADGFPQFESDFDVTLDSSDLGSNSNSRDFGNANDKVLEQLDSDPGALDHMPQDVQDFYAQDNVPNQPPPGYTWHHHQDTGKMQLVPDGVHGDYPHTGGASIWGR